MGERIYIVNLSRRLYSISSWRYQNPALVRLAEPEEIQALKDSRRPCLYRVGPYFFHCINWQWVNWIHTAYRKGWFDFNDAEEYTVNLDEPTYPSPGWWREPNPFAP